MQYIMLGYTPLRWVFVFITVQVSLIDLRSQSVVKFEQLGRNDGLSQSSVNCMLKDKEGFMWFGTQDGLNLYDGKKFRIFQNQPEDTNSITNNYITSLCEDEDGFIWIGTMTGGLNRLHRKTGSFSSFIKNENTNSISDNTVWTVISEDDGKIWAGTSKGLNCFDKHSGTFKTFTENQADSNSLITDMVVSLYKQKNDCIWIGTVKGLCLYEKSTGKFRRFVNPNEKEMPGCNIIWSVSETPDADIVTGTNNGVFKLDSKTGNFRLVLKSQTEKQLVVWSVTAEQPSTLWIGTDQGLFKLNLNDNSHQVFKTEPSNSNRIADNTIWCIMPDNSGFLWAGTKNGISKLKTAIPHFKLLNNESGSASGLSSSNVMAILEDTSGFLWIGTDGGGLNCISPDKTTNVVYNSGNSGLTNDAVWALEEDKFGNIWIGNYQGGLHVKYRNTKIIKSFPYKQGDTTLLSNNRILVLKSDLEGKIWIGTRSGGLIRFDPMTNSFKSYLNSPGDSTSISGNTILSLAFDSKNRLWAGVHEGGLNMLTPGTDRFIAWKKNSLDASGLSDNNIWTILFDKKNRLWLGTQGGLNFTEQPGQDMKFKYISTREGLRSNIVFGLADDNTGNIWMSNFNGLAKLDINTFESQRNNKSTEEEFPGFSPLIRVFDMDDGLQGPEFNQGAFYKGKSGILYFGGTNGLNYFSAEDVKESSFMPPVVITGFKIFNKDVSVLSDISDFKSTHRVIRIGKKGKNYFIPVHISFIKDLKLTWRESVFSFEFAALDYSNPNRNQYAYKMVNFDENWNYTGSQNTATYTNLNAGEYFLMIRGTNSDGTWNLSETVLKITIIPPYWKTWWFALMVTFLILMIVFLAIRQVFVNQQEKSKREKDFIELQLKTIKSQIDPHFAFNALNTIASFIYSEKPDVTYDYFTRFALMIRNILNDQEKISRTLKEELDFVKNYLELQKIRFKDKFNYLILVGDGISHEMSVPKMIIQTYVENSIKHGLMHRPANGFLSVKIENIDNYVKVEIEDNGIGRVKAIEYSANSTHKGLRIMEQIIELYKRLYQTEITQEVQDLTDEKGIASGTKVVLTISELYKPKTKTSFFKEKDEIRNYN